MRLRLTILFLSFSILCLSLNLRGVDVVSCDDIAVNYDQEGSSETLSESYGLSSMFGMGGSTPNIVNIISSLKRSLIRKSLHSQIPTAHLSDIIYLSVNSYHYSYNTTPTTYLAPRELHITLHNIRI